ncbi:glycosyltransferase family 4 protein [Corynebacterium aurimucosum]|uniref:Glycosyltransferase family 4 protein n=1 Tax=Corynebacterium aurimucosum TaxID=169292 RepID=A0A558IQW9_9CORY|nr:glycosyltransferase family 4 protein [Corynebacterium aurimucosum]TVU83632.1 glycosyltransferase family 4 protein [Corynebacterium aurimucosum]
MNVLVVVNRIGPLIGLVLGEIEAFGYTPIVLNVKERKLYGATTPVPAWLNADGDLPSAKWFEDMLTEFGIGYVIGIGVWPSLFAAKNLDRRTVVSVLQPGELDFSQRRNKAKLVAFEQLADSAAGLVFLNEWEMSKAVSLGSTAPHFLWNLADSSCSTEMLDESSDVVGVVVDTEENYASVLDIEYAVSKLGEALEAEGKKVRVISSNSFFWYKDFTMGRSFRNVLRLRGREFSSLFFVGGDADSLVVAASHNGGMGRCYAAERIEMRLLARNQSFLSVCGVDKLVHEYGQPGDAGGSSSMGSQSHGRSLFAIIDQITEKDLPRYWEDYGDFEEFSLFFSVAAVENRSNGARPQRIRNLYLEMADNWLTLQIGMTTKFLERRSKLVEDWLNSGKRCVLIYGENSTNPVQNRDVIIQAYRLVDLASSISRTPSLWFVRDLHWLDSSMFPEGPSADVLASGIFELTRLDDSFGSFVAPSLESRRMFETLLESNCEISFVDDELPPGVTQSACALARGPEKGMTFVYSGGIGSAYRMDAYLTAIASILLDESSSSSSFGRVYFDFVVRPQEQQELIGQLEVLGIAESPFIRVLNGDFNGYRPLTEKACGVLLLESDYGKGAFPYKSVSYLERGFTILCFKDSPVNRLFGPVGVTFATGYDSGEVTATMARAAAEDTHVSWQEIWQKHGWAERLKKIQALAVTAERELR